MITSPTYSIVQFSNANEPGCCIGSTDIALPMMTPTDFYFQILSNTPPPSLVVINSKGLIMSAQSGWVLISPGVYGWNKAINITGIKVGECFQLKLGTALSNVFKKIQDDCYTAIIEYFNDNDYAGFLYCNTDFVNRARLPIHLSQPKMIEDRAVYRKSNGAIKLTKSLLTKEYSVQSDSFPEKLHDALSVALAHDNVSVYSEIYSGAISKTGEYVINWEEGMCLAQSEFKVLATPLAIRNSNCFECEEIIPCVPPNVPVFTLHDAPVNQEYYKAIPVTGNGPFTLSNIIKPGWMSITLSGSTVTFTGKPEAVGSDNIMFTVNNECGNFVANATITVADIPCENATISGAIPGGTVGQAYTGSLTLTGTPPFALSGITKPSWMNIVVSGMSVNLTGTPDASGSGIAVEFTIINCGASEASFVDEIVINDPVVKTVTLEVDNLSLDIWLADLLIDGNPVTLLGGGGGGLPVPTGDIRYSEDVFANTITVTPSWTAITPGQKVTVIDSYGDPSCISTDIGGTYPFSNIDNTGPDPIRILLADGDC